MFIKIKKFFSNYLCGNKMPIPRKNYELDREAIDCILAILDENGKIIQYIAITKLGIFFEVPSVNLEQLIRNSGIKVVYVESRLFKLNLSHLVEMLEMQNQLTIENHPAASKLTNG